MTECGLLTICEIAKSDMDSVLEIYKQCEDFLALGPEPHASAQMVRDDLRLSQEEGGTYCGIYIDHAIVGIVDFVESAFRGDPESAFLSLLMISKKHRGKGIGRDAVNAVERAIRKNKEIKFIRTAVQTNNPAAIAFWNRMGYQIVSGAEVQPDTTVTYRLSKAVR